MFFGESLLAINPRCYCQSKYHLVWDDCCKFFSESYWYNAHLYQNISFCDHASNFVYPNRLVFKPYLVFCCCIGHVLQVERWCLSGTWTSIFVNFYTIEQSIGHYFWSRILSHALVQCFTTLVHLGEISGVWKVIASINRIIHKFYLLLPFQCCVPRKLLIRNEVQFCTPECEISSQTEPNSPIIFKFSRDKLGFSFSTSSYTTFRRQLHSWVQCWSRLKKIWISETVPCFFYIIFEVVKVRRLT